MKKRINVVKRNLKHMKKQHDIKKAKIVKRQKRNAEDSVSTEEEEVLQSPESKYFIEDEIGKNSYSEEEEDDNNHDEDNVHKGDCVVENLSHKEEYHDIDL